MEKLLLDNGLTEDQARTVDLPLNPIKRAQACVGFAEEYDIEPVGKHGQPIPVWTRRGLVVLAQHNDAAKATRDALLVHSQVDDEPTDPGNNSFEDSGVR